MEVLKKKDEEEAKGVLRFGWWGDSVVCVFGLRVVDAPLSVRVTLKPG